VLQFAFPLLTQRHGGSYEEKMAAQEKIESRADQQSLFHNFLMAFGRNALLLVGMAIAAVVLANMLGLKHAELKEDFYITKDRPNFVVVWIDGDVLVSAGFNPKDKRLSGDYVVQKLSDSKPWSLRKEHIGPLKAPAKN